MSTLKNRIEALEVSMAKSNGLSADSLTKEQREASARLAIIAMDGDFDKFIEHSRIIYPEVTAKEAREIFEFFKEF